MDLTKIVLPTFILERRSLLEMYADFFAHPDLFVEIPSKASPEERMIQVTLTAAWHCLSWLGWAGLGWAGLGWAGLGRAGPGRAGPGLSWWLGRAGRCVAWRTVASSKRGGGLLKVFLLEQESSCRAFGLNIVSMYKNKFL